MAAAEDARIAHTQPCEVVIALPQKRNNDKAEPTNDINRHELIPLTNHCSIRSHIASRPPLTQWISPWSRSAPSTRTMVGLLTPGQARSTSA